MYAYYNILFIEAKFKLFRKKNLSTCFRETLSKFVIFLEYFRKATQNYFFPFFLSCNFIFLPNECPGLCQAFKECTSKYQIRITLGATLFLGLHRHHCYTERTISQVVSPFIGVKKQDRYHSRPKRPFLSGLYFCVVLPHFWGSDFLKNKVELVKYRNRGKFQPVVLGYLYFTYLYLFLQRNEHIEKNIKQSYE